MLKMDAELGNYTIPADNKGILSLLTAIEQSEDHDQPETSPTKLGDKEPLSVSTDNFSNLNLETLASDEMNLANLSLCLICGRNFNVETTHNGMIDINTLIDIPGEDSRSVQSVVEEIIPVMRSDKSECTEPDPDSGYVCVECFLLVDGILKLRAQIHEYISTLKTKYMEWVVKKKSAKLPELLEFRIPISILSVRDEDDNLDQPNSSSLSHSNENPQVSEPPGGHMTDNGSNVFYKKTKLQILAETLEDEPCSPSSVVETGEFQLPTDGLDTGVQDVELDLQRSSKHSDLPVTGSIDPSRLHHMDKVSIGKENLEGCSWQCLSCGEKLKPSKSKKNKVKNFCDICFKIKGFKKGHPCIECGLMLKTKTLLEAHKKSKHSSHNQTQYDCSECSQIFSSKQSRTKHENTVHKARATLECDECGECFQSSQTLQFHKSRHTGEFSYKCSHCGKGFNNFKLLEEHQHIHTGSKPYSCSQCPKSFANRGSLWLHVKKHQNDKPYICDYCLKGFGHASHLAVHRRMHTGERPYSCRLCEEGFVSSNHLKRHMKSHPNEDPFACGLCDQTFQKRSALSKHGNDEHGGKIVDAATALSNNLSNQKLVEEDTTLHLTSSKGDSTVFEHITSTSITVTSASSSSCTPSVATDRISTAMTSAAAIGRSKEYLLVDQTDRILSLPKLEDEADFVLPVNIMEEDPKDQPIVFIQVSDNPPFQSGFMQ